MRLLEGRGVNVAMLVRQLSPETLDTPSGPPSPAADPTSSPSDRRSFWLGRWAYVGHLLAIWGLALSNLFHGLAILFTAHAWRRGRLARWQWPRLAPLLVPLGVYAIFLAVSVAVSYDPLASLDELDEVFALCTLPLAALLVRGPRATRRLVDLLIAMAAVLALHGIAQYYFTDFGDLDNRIPGGFSHTQTFAGVLLIGDLLLIARLAAPGSRRRWWEWAALVAVTWTLMLTLTRGSWVALAAAFAVLVAIRGRRRTLIVGLVALAAALLLAPASWRSRVSTIFDLRDPSNYDRLCMIEAGAHMVRERPLFGLGPGQVRERYPIYRHPTAPRYDVKHLHNSFLQQAAERGLLALGAYLWLMAACFRLAYRGYRRSVARGRDRADLYLGALLVLVGFNVAGLFEANWRDTEVQRLALFVMAIPLCLRAARAEAKPADPGESL